MNAEELGRLREGHTACTAESCETVRALDEVDRLTNEAARLDHEWTTELNRRVRAEADLADQKRRHAETEQELLDARRLIEQAYIKEQAHAELRAGVSLAAQGLAAWSGVPGDEGRVRGVEHSLRALSDSTTGEPT